MLRIAKHIILAIILAHVVNAIINGDLVEISNYPYAASIISQNLHRCGGSIIDAKYILTAASCVADYQAADLTVRAGSSFYTEGGQLVEVKSIHFHPDFNTPGKLYNNLAILELSSPLVLGENVAVIPVDTTGNVKVTGNGTVVGWGIVIRNESGWVKPYKPSEQLRLTDQPKVGEWVCYSTFIEGWDPEKMFCAGIYLKDNCVGDIGNPFVFDGVLLGVASQTLLMCGQFPTAYMNLTLYADFINEFIST